MVYRTMIDVKGTNFAAYEPRTGLHDNSLLIAPIAVLWQCISTKKHGCQVDRLAYEVTCISVQYCARKLEVAGHGPGVLCVLQKPKELIVLGHELHERVPVLP